MSDPAQTSTVQGPSAVQLGLQRINQAFASTGQSITEADLDSMLGPMCSTPQELADAKLKYIAHAQATLPANGQQIPILGQKPEDGGEPALRTIPIPADELSIRFFPGGVERGRGMVFFDFVNSDNRGVRMPAGYRLTQPTIEGNVQLRGLNAVFGHDAPPGGESFTTLEGASVILSRPGRENFVFYT